MTKMSKIYPAEKLFTGMTQIFQRCAANISLPTPENENKQKFNL